MSLTYPLGLVALVAIPVLILIYIIKNKYTEKTVSSTYIWTLSERFIKKRRPISRIVGIISLLLQIAAVVMIAVSVAHPVFIVPAAAKEYCFILDGSGSMNIVENGQTRFDRAKDRISGVIDDAYKGSVYSLIFAGETTETVFEGYTDKERCKKLLEGLSVSNCASTLSDAAGRAQILFDANPSVDIYLMTDKTFGSTENLTVVNVAKDAVNYAASNPTYLIEDGRLRVDCDVTSYGADASLSVELYLDDTNQAVLKNTVDVNDGETKRVAFVCENKITLKSARIVIADADALAVDNEVVIYNVDHENSSRTLIVSDYPFYIQAALIAAGNSQIDVVEPDKFEYNGGYDLYIFDSFTPLELPNDGAVWFFNPRSSLGGTNFNFQGDAYPSSAAQFSTSTAKTVKYMLDGLAANDFELAKYVRIGQSGKFTNLVTLDGSPLIFAGTNDFGNREVVFAFDLHASASFTLSPDFTLLTANLLSYSFPAIIDGTSYFAGDTLQINTVPGTESLYVLAPSGKEYFPDSSLAVCEFSLREVGSYQVTLTLNDKTTRTFNVYVAMPEDERVTKPSEERLFVVGIAQNNKRSGIYDSLIAYIIILAVVAVADFGVYSYEQYQLR